MTTEFLLGATLPDAEHAESDIPRRRWLSVRNPHGLRGISGTVHVTPLAQANMTSQCRDNLCVIAACGGHVLDSQTGSELALVGARCRS